MFVHVIDDDEKVARTVARSASRLGWETSVHYSAEAFLGNIEDAPFGCIVTDIRMPGMTGTELIEILYKSCPEWPVVMMTGHAEVGAAISSFRHGAVHFLQKPFRREDLGAALTEAAQVGEKRKAEVARRREAAVLDRLTPREKEILTAFASGRQSKAVAWECGISTRTVEMHRSNILAKLGARNTSQAVGLMRLAGEVSL